VDVATVATLFALLTVVADVAVIAIALVALAGRRRPKVRQETGDTLGPSALWLAFLVASIATLGSLYLSEVAHFVPCTLCWYQRIAMYPLVPILLIAAWRHEVAVVRFAIPLTVAGAAIAIYHYQLERFPTQVSVSCDVAAPCTVVWIWRFHFVSIPFMALSGFALITALLLVARSASRVNADETDAKLTASDGTVSVPAHHVEGRR